eukprot:2859666-Amphidinium_carterae.1
MDPSTQCQSHVEVDDGICPRRAGPPCDQHCCPIAPMSPSNAAAGVPGFHPPRPLWKAPLPRSRMCVELRRLAEPALSHWIGTAWCPSDE